MANFHVYKILSNNTVLNGTLVRIPVEGIDFGGKEQTTNATTADDDYDAEGAMQFILATVLVYSIFGVFCTLMLRIKRIRGKSHHNYLQDESVTRYLKSESVLKYDGMRFKWVQDCEIVSEKLRQIEERKKYRDLEAELSQDFASQPKVERKTILKRKGRRKRDRALQNTISKMGVALFYVGSREQIQEDADISFISGIQEMTSSVSTFSKPREDTPLLEPVSMLMTKQVDSDNNVDCNSDVETQI